MALTHVHGCLCLYRIGSPYFVFCLPGSEADIETLSVAGDVTLFGLETPKIWSYPERTFI